MPTMKNRLTTEYPSHKDYRTIIRELLPIRYPTIDHVAHLLGVPVRTLQRRFQKNGISYSELVEETRCELAIRLLAEPGMPVAAVARALGYADPSSFSRAFRRWTGMAPKAYRRRQ